ncbi:MAG: hypothetical protein ACRD6X_20135 [Pyrinomonadaceae bacterium]
MAQFDLTKYIPVHARIAEFYEKYPQGRIVTEIIRLDEETGFVCIKASVYRNPDDAEPSATGHAFEVRGQGYVNTTSFIENGETSAVGRALANLGFKIENGLASREEMQKVERMTNPALPHNGNDGRLVSRSVS